MNHSVDITLSEQDKVNQKKNIVEFLFYNLITKIFFLYVNDKETIFSKTMMDKIKRDAGFTDVDYYLGGTYGNMKNFDFTKIVTFEKVHQNLGIPVDIKTADKVIVNRNTYNYWFLFRNYPLMSYLRSFNVDIVLYSQNIIGIVEQKKIIDTYGINITKFLNSKVNDVSVNKDVNIRNDRVLHSLKNPQNPQSGPKFSRNHTTPILYDSHITLPVSTEPIMTLSTESIMTSSTTQQQSGGSGLQINFVELFKLHGYEIQFRNGKMFRYIQSEISPDGKLITPGKINLYVKNIIPENDNPQEQPPEIEISVSVIEHKNILNEEENNMITELNTDSYGNKHLNIYQQLEATFELAKTSNKHLVQLLLYINFFMNGCVETHEIQKMRNSSSTYYSVKGYLKNIIEMIHRISSNDHIKSGFKKIGFYMWKERSRNSDFVEKITYSDNSYEKFQSQFLAPDFVSSFRSSFLKNCDGKFLFKTEFNYGESLAIILDNTKIERDKISFLDENFILLNEIISRHQTYTTIDKDDAIKFIELYTRVGSKIMNEILSKLRNKLISISNVQDVANDLAKFYERYDQTIVGDIKEINMKQCLESINNYILNVTKTADPDKYIVLFSSQIPFIFNHNKYFDLSLLNKGNKIYLSSFTSTTYGEISERFVRMESNIILVIIARTSSKILNLNYISHYGETEKEFLLPYGASLDIFHTEYKNHNLKCLKFIYCYYNDPDPSIVDLESFIQYMDNLNTSNKLEVKSNNSTTKCEDIEIPNRGLFKKYEYKLLKYDQQKYISHNITNNFNIWSLQNEFINLDDDSKPGFYGIKINFKMFLYVGMKKLDDINDFFEYNRWFSTPQTAYYYAFNNTHTTGSWEDPHRLPRNRCLYSIMCNFDDTVPLYLVDILNDNNIRNMDIFVNTMDYGDKKTNYRKLLDEHVKYNKTIPTKQIYGSRTPITNPELTHMGKFIHAGQNDFIVGNHAQYYDKYSQDSNIDNHWFGLIQETFGVSAYISRETPSLHHYCCVFDNELAISKEFLNHHKSRISLSDTNPVSACYSSDTECTNYFVHMLYHNLKMRSIIKYNKVLNYFNDDQICTNDICDGLTFEDTKEKCKIIQTENEFQTYYDTNIAPLNLI